MTVFESKYRLKLLRFIVFTDIHGIIPEKVGSLSGLKITLIAKNQPLNPKKLLLKALLAPQFIPYDTFTRYSNLCMNPIKPSTAIVIFTLLSVACATISKFDQYSYSQATSIKVDALNMMDAATDSFPGHQEAVNGIMTSIDKIYEYEKNRPKNVVTEKMWALMKDTSGHLYGGFISRWKKEGKLDKVFIMESKKLIGESFDEIAQLESGKIKPAQPGN